MVVVPHIHEKHARGVTSTQHVCRNDCLTVFCHAFMSSFWHWSTGTFKWVLGQAPDATIITGCRQGVSPTPSHHSTSLCDVWFPVFIFTAWLFTQPIYVLNYRQMWISPQLGTTRKNVEYTVCAQTVEQPQLYPL